MGTYTTGTEVYQLLINLKVGSPTRLSEADIEPIIAGLEAQVNGVLLGQGYTIPATGPNDLALIREQVRKKAAVQTFLTLTQPDRSPDWCRSWDIDFSEWMTALRKGQLRLVDQTPLAAQEGQTLITYFTVVPMVEDDPHA